MNHKQRIRAALTGQPLDRPPVSVWGHDFLREWSAQDLSDQTVENQRRYNYDFVKINPRCTMFAEPWGNQYLRPTEQRFPKLTRRIIASAADIDQVTPVDCEHPVFAEHVQAVQTIVDELGGEVDCLATLFSPLAVLGLLAGGVGEPLVSLAQEDSDAAHRALTHITKTLTEHAQQLVAAGISGLFYAPLQWTSLDVCTERFYAEFGAPYDHKLLEQFTEQPFNMLHVCGNNIDLSRFYDYPVAVLNWDNFGPGNPSLAEARQQSGKVVAGGIPHRKLHKLDEDQLLALAEEALTDTASGVMLAGGCGIGAMTPDQPRAAVVGVANRLVGRVEARPSTP